MAIASTRPTTAAICSPSTSRPDASSGSRTSARCRKRRPCYADGKIYIGTESGKFYILRPHADKCEVLSEVEMPISDHGPGVAKDSRADRGRRGSGARARLFRFQRHALRDRPEEDVCRPVETRRAQVEAGQGAPAWVQVAPTEMVLKPGQTVQLHARLFDAQGRFLREDNSAAWSLDHLKGTVDRRQIHGGR